MADDVDIANDLDLEVRDRAVAEITSKIRRGPSRTYCLDCDDVIPHERRKLGGVLRCVCCQEINDRRSKN